LGFKRALARVLKGIFCKPKERLLEAKRGQVQHRTAIPSAGVA